MEAAFSLYPKPFTANDISKLTGLESARISKALTHYHVHNLHYFRRLKIKSPDHCYRYVMNKKCKKTYIAFVRRIKSGFDLNLKKSTPLKMETYAGTQNIQIKSIDDLFISPEQIKPYIRLTSQGKHEMDLKKEDLLELAGIVKNPPNEPDEIEVLDEPEATVITSKVYQTKSGDNLTSAEMAETMQFGIEQLNNQIKATSDAKKIKKLQDKKRIVLMWIHYHPDVKQYIQNVKEPEVSVKTSFKPDIALDRDYKQAEKLVRTEIHRIQEKLKTVDDIEEIEGLRNRLNKCRRWFEDNKGFYKFNR